MTDNPTTKGHAFMPLNMESSALLVDAGLGTRSRVTSCFSRISLSTWVLHYASDRASDADKVDVAGRLWPRKLSSFCGFLVSSVDCRSLKKGYNTHEEKVW